MALEYLIYHSHALFPAGEAALAPILSCCMRNNARDGITGLLFRDGSVLVQYLEGPTDALDALQDRLARDKRHRDMAILVRASLAARRVDVPMGYVDGAGTDLAQTLGAAPEIDALIGFMVAGLGPAAALEQRA